MKSKSRMFKALLGGGGILLLGLAFLLVWLAPPSFGQMARDIARLAGDWCGDMVGGNVRCGNEYKTRISGTTIEFSMYPWHNRWVVIFRGEVRGNKIEGVNITYDSEGTSDCSATTPMTGTVINDNRIELDYDAVSVYSERNTCKIHERRPARKVFLRRPSG